MDAPDKFQYKWINLDSVRLKASIGMDDSVNIIQLPPIIQAAKNGSVEEITQLVHEGISVSCQGKRYFFIRHVQSFSAFVAFLCTL